MHLVIDGYNLIHATDELRNAEARGEGVAALVQALTLYRKARPHRLTLVLDGGEDPAGGRAAYKGVKVRYSGQGRTADDLIASMAAQEGPGLTAVTNDRELADRCRAHGAEVVGAELFAQRLLEAALYEGAMPDDESEDEGWDFTTKKKGPSHRLPRGKRRRRRKLERL